MGRVFSSTHASQLPGSEVSQASRESSVSVSGGTESKVSSEGRVRVGW